MRQAFLSAQRAHLFAQMLVKATNSEQVMQLAPQYAIQLLQAGRSEPALRQFEQIETFARENQLTLNARTTDTLRLLRAVSLLRIGEQENCLINHNADSCIFPIHGGGIHQLPRG